MTQLGFRLAMVTALGAVVVGLWLVSSSGGDAPEKVAPEAEASGRLPRNSAASPRLASSAPASFDNAARLLELGVAGDLSVDMHTRSALDILLASLGPNPTAADLQRLEDSLRRSMPGEAATQAMALVRRYDAYHRAANTEAAAQQAPSTPEELKALLDKAMALRRQHFDESTARALFGAEEEQTRLDMALNAIQADPRLSAQEKAAQMSALRERAPRDLPGWQAPVSPAFSEMDTQVARLREQGASPTQIEQLRTRTVGAEAAHAMAETEAQAAQWRARYQAFAEQKKTIVAAGSPDMAAQIDAALRQHFKEEELPAARAYDRTQKP